MIDGSWQTGGTIYLGAVTAWEIALLVDSRRIELDLPVEAWRSGWEVPCHIAAHGTGHGARYVRYYPHRSTELFERIGL